MLCYFISTGDVVTDKKLVLWLRPKIDKKKSNNEERFNKRQPENVNQRVRKRTKNHRKLAMLRKPQVAEMGQRITAETSF
jgi:hypothetical protein